MKYDLSKIPATGGDYTQAIQHAINELKIRGGGVLHIPAGTWMIHNTIDLTGCSNLTITGEGFGSVLRCYAHIPGSVFECTGANALTFRDFQVFGVEESRPQSAFLLARGVANGSAGRHLFSHVMVSGYFTKAAIASVSSEANTYRDCEINNYAEECVLPVMQAVSTNLTFSIDRCLARDITTIAHLNGNMFFRRLSGTTTIAINNCGSYTTKGLSLSFVGTTGTRPQMTNSVFVGGGGTGGGGFVGFSYCVIDTNDTAYSAASIVADYNIFYRRGSSVIRSSINSTLYQTLADWQAATSQDTNSVFCKSADQTSGNQYALWLGVSTAANAGPADGDFRINPGARVYNGADAPLIGTFADGVTPLTDAGIQEYWDWNARAVVTGVPTRFPTFPATVAEMRSYVNDPESWDFYP